MSCYLLHFPKVLLRMSFTKETYIVFLSFCVTMCCTYFDTKPDDHCFCKLKGHIDDCTCNVDTVDHFNNVKIYPRLKSLLINDYFRFYKVNLKRDCPFWSDDSRCAIRFCHVETCDDNDIPIGLKGTFKQTAFNNEYESAKKYTKDITSCTDDHNEELSYLNTTISDANYKEFELWKVHDDAQDSFCAEQEDNGGSEYVDLLLNPERYTGYRGASAHRIWRSIYRENCFWPRQKITSYIQTSNLNGMCLEKRVFYRVISGLHSSINIHLCSNYLLSEKRRNVDFVSPGGQWGPNIEEFQRRFHPSTTNGEGPHWLRNLYFVYLLELRAIAKASTYLKNEEFYTGDDANDENLRLAVDDFLNVVRSFPNHFDESIMFNSGSFEARKLKEEFRQHFRNITRIMDCVGCDKCKLWGKLQIQGLGTALKILFSGKFDDRPSDQYLKVAKTKFNLKRGEIVSLINGFGRLSTSIFELEEFRKMYR